MLLLQRREQLPRGLQAAIQNSSRHSRTDAPSRRTADKASSLQIMPVLVKTRHQLRLSRHLALRFERLREPLQLARSILAFASAFSGFFRQNRRLRFRLGQIFFCSVCASA
jgi:hypothetical protein